MFSYKQREVYKKSYQVNQKVYRFLKGNRVIPTYTKNQLGRDKLYKVFITILSILGIAL